ncbi:MAG: hypothetical protein EXS39_01315 [Opitutaceae bacterium]|nr:hypothetical protein [Opitutaceae bacterium]
MRLVLRVFHGLMAALFVFAAALQYNDLDPLRWMAIYLAAAAICLAAAAGHPRPLPAAALVIVALAWAALYVIHGAWRVPLPALFSQWEMKDETIVAGREMYGLLIVAGWMAVAWANGRKPAALLEKS